jgi:hypothetical protein
MPETNLDAYARSIDQLALLAPSVRRVLPGHNTAVASPALLGAVRQALADMRSGRLSGTVPSPGQRQFTFDGFSVLVSESALTGWQKAATSSATPARIP